MNFDPQKFFIGVVDFFSVLMPGALLAYFGKFWAGSYLPVPFNAKLDNAEQWIVFLFASYLLGHFLFLFGALLDESVYDPLRQCTDLGQIRRLAEGKKKNLSSRILRLLANSSLFFGSNADAAVTHAQRIKARALKGLSAGGAINAFQWCKARLSKEHQEGLAAVQRFEADSKFFRGLTVVLAVLAPLAAFRGQDVLAIACIGGFLLALWRYIDVRFKATQQAYWLVIALEASKASSASESDRPRKTGRLTHAGGVVFRKNGNSIEYLLVQAEKRRKQWVLPKGHIEAGESPRETAVREVVEEAGYWARVVDWLKDLQLNKGKANAATVRFFCMELAGNVEDVSEEKKKSNWPPEKRQYKWLTLAKAKKLATFRETKRLLQEVSEKINKMA